MKPIGKITPAGDFTDFDSLVSSQAPDESQGMAGGEWLKKLFPQQFSQDVQPKMPGVQQQQIDPSAVKMPQNLELSVPKVPGGMFSESYTGGGLKMSSPQYKRMAGQIDTLNEYEKKLLFKRSGLDDQVTSQAIAKEMSDAPAITELLNGFEGTVASVPEWQKGPIFGLLKDTPIAGKYLKEAQMAQADIKKFSQLYGRFMEGGVLRKEDEVKYEKMFPQLDELPEVQSYKLYGLRRQMSIVFNKRLEVLSASGVDIRGLKPIPVPPALKMTDFLGKEGRQGDIDIEKINKNITNFEKTLPKIGMPKGDDLNTGILGSLIRGVGSGATFGYAPKFADWLMGQITGDPGYYQDRAEKYSKDYPVSNVVGNIAGFLTPGGAGSGMIKIGEAALPIKAGSSILKRILQNVGQGAIVGGGYSAASKIPELATGDADKRISALKEILASTAAGGAIQGVMGPASQALTKYLRKAPQVEGALESISGKSGKTFEEVGGAVKEAAKTKATAGKQAYESLALPRLTEDTITKINSRQTLAKILQDAGVMSKTGKIFKDKISDTSGRYGGLRKIMYKYFNKLKEPEYKSIEGMDKLKQDIGSEVSRWVNTSGGSKKFADSLLKKVYGSMKEDISAGATKIHGEKGAKLLETGMKKYGEAKKTLNDLAGSLNIRAGVESATKKQIYKKVFTKIDDPEAVEIMYKAGVHPSVTQSVAIDRFLNLTPNNFLKLEPTFKAMKSFSDESLKKIFGKDVGKVINLRDSIGELMNAGETKILMPKELGPSLIGMIQNMSFIGKHNAAATAITKALDLLGSTIIGATKIPIATSTTLQSQGK